MMDDLKQTISSITFFRDADSLSEIVFTKFIKEYCSNSDKKIYKKLCKGKSEKTIEDVTKDLNLSENDLFVTEEKPKETIVCYLLRDTFLLISRMPSTSYLTVSIMTQNEDLKNRFGNYFDKLFIQKDKEKKNIYMLAQGPSGLEFMNVCDLSVPLERGNYSEEILKKFDYIAEQFSKDKPNARLAIVSGSPGTGKTYAIKGILDKIKGNNSFIYLSSKFLSELDGPALIPLLLDKKFSTTFEENYSSLMDDFESNMFSEPKRKETGLVLIIEDADLALTERENSDLSLVSSLLNMTDGLFGDVLNLKIIASTNAPKIRFDKAMSRRGRLLTNVLVDKLDVSKAGEVYKRLTGYDHCFEKPVCLAEVYSLARNDQYDEEPKEKETKVGFLK